MGRDDRPTNRTGMRSRQGLEAACQDAGEGVERRAYKMIAPPGMALTVTGNSRPWRVTVRPGR